MTKPTSKAPITIRLEISIPAELAAGVQISPNLEVRPPRILMAHATHPGQNGQTFVRPVDGKYVMCTFGPVGGARHVAARVYPGDFDVTTLGDDPPQNDPLVRIVYVDGLPGDWQIDDLPVEGPVGQKQLVLWSEQDGSYVRVLPATPFTAVASTYTYCELYGSGSGFGSLPALHGHDWSQMSERWQFQIAGCTNKECKNCKCLNGKWVLTRERKLGEYVWVAALEESVAAAGRRSFWRLTFCKKDGFWYLDYVESLNQATGLWISYRLHEKDWNPCGANKMLFHSDGGYCHVPEAVTLNPV